VGSESSIRHLWRSLITAVFDFVYFPLKAAFGVDVYWAYKVFSATVFAEFLTIVYRYVLGTLSTSEEQGCSIRCGLMCFPGGNTRDDTPLDKSSPIESGLLLESIPMPIRPLSSKDCADQFILAYKRMFAKYYGVNDVPLFR
jgi:hypothetical protein